MSGFDRRTFLKVGALAAAAATTAIIRAPQSHDRLLSTPEGVTLNYFPSQKYLATANFGLVDDNLFFFSGWPERELEISHSTDARLGKVIEEFTAAHPTIAFVQSYLGPTAPPAWCPSEPLLRARGKISVVAHSAGAATLALALEENPSLVGKIERVTLICPAISLNVVLPPLFSGFMTKLSGYPSTDRTLKAYAPFAGRRILSLITASDDSFVDSERVKSAFWQKFGEDKIDFSEKPINCHGLTANELTQIINLSNS